MSTTKRRIALLAVTAGLIALTWPSLASAYLDPGTGSMILQAVIGAVVGAMITLNLYWTKLKNYFVSKRSGETEPEKDSSAN